MLMRRVALAVLGLLAGPADAALIPFTNCLTNSYQKSGGLQFTPLYVDTTFDTSNRDHRFTMTVWGNVSGSSGGETIPTWNSSEWTDDNSTAGKILDSAGSGKITNLKSSVNVLTYTPYSGQAAFCDEIEGGNCPLAPVFTFNESSLPDGLPYFVLDILLNSSYSFTTITPTFQVINSDKDQGTQIACISASATPSLGNLGWLLTILPLLILVFLAAVNIFASVFSPWGTTDIFKWSSNHSRDAPVLLRLVTPGFADCIQYYQFVVLTSCLSLNYPGFYRPMTSHLAWSTLLFNTSFASNEPNWNPLMDGVYHTTSNTGLGTLGQLVGLAGQEDIWTCLVVWLLVIVAGVLLLSQVGFLLRRMYRFLANVEKEDLRKKNLPFSIGNVVRIIFNYFLLPIISFSIFQLRIGASSPTFLVALSAIVLVGVIVASGWLLFYIFRKNPRSDLFDHLPTLLKYGPLYNTYADDAPPFACVHIGLTFLRGIAIGGAQGSGVTQIALLCFAEALMMIAIIFYRPYNSETSMNLGSGVCAGIRLITVLLMVAFSPSLGITEGPKGWVAYVILFIHACVVFVNFFINGVITLTEVIARLLGAGGQTTNGFFSGILGARQLSSRRLPHHRRTVRHKPGHSSQIAMIQADGNVAGFYVPTGHARNESGSSLPGASTHNRTPSGYDPTEFAPPLSGRRFDSANSSGGPVTPTDVTANSFNRPTPSRPAAVMKTEPLYFRPPRTTKKPDALAPLPLDRRPGSVADSRHLSFITPSDHPDDISRSGTPAPYAINLSPTADYSTREVDRYYGIGTQASTSNVGLRGPVLNSDRPARRLGTGPADPTGPIATAAGWLRGVLKGKTKEKSKGFEVVRSHVIPPNMRALRDEPPPDGVPVARAGLRKRAIESDEEDDDVPQVRGERSQPVPAPLVDISPPESENGDEHVTSGELTPLGPIISNSTDGQSDSFADAASRLHESSIDDQTFHDMSMELPPTAPPLSHPPRPLQMQMPFMRTASDTSTVTVTTTRNPSISSAFMLNSTQGSVRSVRGQVPQHSVILGDSRLSEISGSSFTEQQGDIEGAESRRQSRGLL